MSPKYIPKYIWAHALNTQLKGRLYSSINETTDDAIISARTVNGTVYQIAQYIAAFNNAMAFPDLGRVGTLPEGLDLSGVNYMNINDTNTFKKTNNQVWKAIVTVYKILKGTGYICNDQEFNNLFDQVKAMPATEVVTVSGIFKGLLQAVPAASKLPPTTVSVQMGIPVKSSVMISSNEQFIELANDDQHAMSISAMRKVDAAGLVEKTYIAKIKLNAVCHDAMLHVGIQTMIHTDPYQYVMYAALMDQLVGATIVVDATQAQRVSNMPDTNVTLVHSSWNQGDSPYFGFKISKLVGAEISGSTLSLKMEVQDLPVGNFAARLDTTPLPDIAPDVTSQADVIMACADAKLAVKFIMQLSGLLKNA